MTETLTWRARLRFRVQKKIRIDGNEHRLQIAGRDVVLTAPTPDLKIMDGEWLMLRDMKKRWNSDRRPTQLSDAARGDLRLASATRRL